MTPEYIIWFAISCAIVGAFGAFTVRLGARWRTVAVTAAFAVTAGTTVFAVDQGLSDGNMLALSCTAWLTLACTIYAARTHRGRDEVFRALLAAGGTLGFIASFHAGVDPALQLFCWYVSLVPLFLGCDVGKANRLLRSERVVLVLHVVSMMLVTAGCLLGDGRLGGRISLTAGAVLRLGIFPAHLGVVGFLKRAPLGAVLAHWLGIFVPLVVCARYLQPLLGQAGLTGGVVSFLLVAAVFFALVCTAQTDLRSVVSLAMLASLSIVVAAFALASSEEAAHAAWRLAINAVVAGIASTLCMDAVSRRVGTTDTARMQGLAVSMPMLAGFSLMAFLELANAPVTWGFVGAEELLVELCVQSLASAALVVTAWSVLAFALVRSFARMFWGPSPSFSFPSIVSTPSIDLGRHERWALLIVVVLLLVPVYSWPV